MGQLIRAGGFLGFRPLVEELGGDADALLRAASLEPEQLVDRDAYVPLRKLALALEAAAKTLNCPDFGLRLGPYFNIEVFGSLAVAMQSADTVRDSFEFAIRFMHFHNTGLALRLTEHAAPGCDFFSARITLRNPPRGVQLNERVLTGAIKLMSVLCGPSFAPKAVHIRHQPFAPFAAYRRAFGVTPLFGAEEDGILLSRALLDIRQATSNPQVQRMAEHFLESIGGRAGDISPRARAIVESMMRSGDCTQARLASALGLHERSLQRRLKEEDASFEAIKDDVRRDLARTYLGQKGVPFSHIAEMLGYAEASAFSRSCRRWFGDTPRAMRRELTAGGMQGA